MSKRSRTQSRRSQQEPWPPEIPDEFEQTLAELPEPLDDDIDYHGFAAIDLSMEGSEASGLSFREMRLVRCTMTRTVFRRSEFSDLRFDSCSLAGADWEKGRLGRIELEDCGMVGMRLFDGTIDDAVIRGSNCDMALFWKSRFSRVRFERSTLRRASFEEADLSGVVFSECDLTGADFRGAKLAGTDFRGSRIDGISVGALDLRGAIITPDQAAALIGLLGVVVKWEGE